jgi:intein/homing endonuclease
MTRRRTNYVLSSITFTTRRVSLNDLAKLIGTKTSGYTSWVCRQLGVRRRPFEEARLRGIREKRRKYERKPFDGTEEDKAYLLGLRHGDLSVSRPWKGVVRVSTSTTHPAMAELFRSLFDPYGHVYQSPRYKKDTDSYEWNLCMILDDSFDFLLVSISEVADLIISRAPLVRAYLAGLFDAEGSISIHASKLLTSLNATYYNTDLKLMEFVFRAISSLGFRPQRPYLDKKKGFVSPGYHIMAKKDYWRVVLGRFEECQLFLRDLPVRHPEKAEKKLLALSLLRGQTWREVGPSVERIRTFIKSDRDAFESEAKRAVLTNPKHHPEKVAPSSN